MDRTLRSQAGFSLVSAMMALGVAGGVALLISKNMSHMQEGLGYMEQVKKANSLETEMMMMLENPNSCTSSLAGLTFRKSAVDNELQMVGKTSGFSSTNEGLNLALWYSQVGSPVRTRKKYNGADNKGQQDKSKIDNITIETIKLILPQDSSACGANYCDGEGADQGQIVAVLAKKQKTIVRRKKAILPVFVSFTTTGGLSTINKCSTSFENSKDYLYLDEHTKKQCQDRGGVVMADGLGADPVYFCRFSNIQQCPTAWSQYQNWSATADGDPIVISSAKNKNNRYKTCVSSSAECVYSTQLRSISNQPMQVHLWSNQTIEFTECAVKICNRNMDNRNSPTTISTIKAYAKVTQIGCY